MALVVDTGNAIGQVLYSLWNGFINVIPGIIAALVVLIIGYYVGALVGYIVKKILIKTKVFDYIMKKTRLTKLVGEWDLPYFFEMGLGGTYDLRGYPENDLRGRAKVMGTLQMRRQVYGPRVFDIPYIGKFDLALNAIVFIDNASLMDCISDFTESRYETTGGSGSR